MFSGPVGALAARPSERAKSEAWQRLLEDRTLTLATAGAIMRGFHQPGQEEVLEPYADHYLDALGNIWRERDLEFSLYFGEAMFPRWVVGEGTIGRVDEKLRDQGLASPLRRLLIEGKDRLFRTIRARRVDAQSAGR